MSTHAFALTPVAHGDRFGLRRPFLFLHERSAHAIGLLCAMASACSGIAQAEQHGIDLSPTHLPKVPAQPATVVGADTFPALGDAPTAQRSTTLIHWLTPDRPRSLGVSFGVATWTMASAPSMRLPPDAVLAGLDLGLRWRARLDTRHLLDMTAWARAPQNNPAADAMQSIWQTQAARFGTRMEVQWTSSRTRGLVPEFGALGIQLESGSRLVLRAKGGRPMVYYRATF